MIIMIRNKEVTKEKKGKMLKAAEIVLFSKIGEDRPEEKKQQTIVTKK